MKKVAIAGLVVGLLAGAAVSELQDAPKLPPPAKEHEWLRQLGGEWETEVEMYMEPDKPPQKSQGTEIARMIGGFWIVAEVKGTFMDRPMTGIFTLGYDTQKKKYVGTWVDSMSSYLWTYEGAVDASGKVLTLEGEGHCPTAPGKLSKFKEVIELKSKDHRVFTSFIQGEDGNWTKGFKASYRRKKAGVG